MTNVPHGFEPIRIAGQEEAIDLMTDLINTARPEAVFGEPRTVGDFTVITAAEVKVGMGYGFGAGGGSGPAEDEGDESQETPTEDGFGGGGGGGGVSGGRPVAAIIASPDGVRVEPIIDLTTIGLACLAALGGLLATRRRMRAIK